VTFEDEEKVVGVVVLVPHELALDLGDAYVAVVDAGDNPGLPVLVEPRELLGQVDLLRHLHPLRRHLVTSLSFGIIPVFDEPDVTALGDSS
jgi:hypothetical protein